MLLEVRTLVNVLLDEIRAVICFVKRNVVNAEDDLRLGQQSIEPSRIFQAAQLIQLTSKADCSYRSLATTNAASEDTSSDGTLSIEDLVELNLPSL